MTPEQRAARLHHHMYETCEGIAEHAERIVDLEELVADMFAFLDGADCARFPAGDVVITQAQVGNFYDRMRELEVDYADRD